MRPVLAAVLCLVVLSGLAVAADDVYTLIRVDLGAPGAQEILQTNPNLDIARTKADAFAEIVTRSRDRAWLAASGLKTEVLIEDMEAHYAARFAGKGENYGDFHTYSEITQWLDDLHALYPQVISAKWSIGQSHEGRDLWCIRVSDNPETDETGEPEVLFDGMHHSRELMASETPMMLAEYFGENYGVDPLITWLLDTREIYIVPVINPDGSVYNELMQPEGGGMWRKNRRDNGDGTYGVDLNRNYPYEWVGPGSSTDTSSDVYRGPSAGSEPETQAMMALINAHEFVTGQSFHCYGNYTLLPWGFSTSPSPDDALFQHMGAIMTRDNGYIPGTAWGTLNYQVNGGSFDWFYGATTEHPKCYAFSNEIGGPSDGFWADISRREALFQENLWPSIYQIMAVGHFVEGRDAVVLGGDGNGRLDAGETAGLSLTFENFGIATTATDVQVQLSTDDPYVQLLETTRSLGDLAAMGTTDVSAAPFAIVVDAALPASWTVTVHVTTTSGDAVHEADFLIPAGSSSTVLSEDFESGTGDWIFSGTWDLTSTYANSPVYSLTDSPGGDYSDYASDSATSSSPIVIPTSASLNYWTRYSIEDGWDYGRVQVSEDGLTWDTVASHTGSIGAWTPASADLSSYAGLSMFLRFTLESDSWVTDDGWYIDDIELDGIPNAPARPDAPVATAPAASATVGATPTLEVAAGAGITPTSYGYVVYSDADLTQVAASVDGIVDGGGIGQWTTPVLSDGDYWWRAYADDGATRSDLCAAETFTVVGTTDVVTDGVFALRRVGNAGELRFRVVMPNSGDLSVEIFNARGQRLDVLASGHHAEGEHLLQWNGRDDQGRSAASGVYFVRALSGNDVRTERFVVVR